jgi:hypothetical protein
LQGSDVVGLGDRKPGDWPDGVPSAEHLDTLGRFTSGLHKSINRGFSKFGATRPAYEEKHLTPPGAVRFDRRDSNSAISRTIKQAAVWNVPPCFG